MATDEEARAARDARLQQLHERLTAAVDQLVSGEDWKRALEFAARFRAKSFNNTLLIWAQHLDLYEAGRTSAPEPTFVGQVPGSGVTVFEVVGGLYLSGLQGRHHLRAHHGLLLRGQGLTAPGEQFQAEIPAAFGPFICLLGQHGPDQAHHGIPVREDPHRVRAAPDLPVQPLGGVVRPDLAPHVPRERGEREDVLSSGV